MVLIKLRVAIPSSRLIVLAKIFHCNDRVVNLTDCFRPDFPPLTVVLDVLSGQVQRD